MQYLPNMSLTQLIDPAKRIKSGNVDSRPYRMDIARALTCHACPNSNTRSSPTYALPGPHGFRTNPLWQLHANCAGSSISLKEVLKFPFLAKNLESHAPGLTLAMVRCTTITAYVIKVNSNIFRIL